MGLGEGFLESKNRDEATHVVLLPERIKRLGFIP